MIRFAISLLFNVLLFSAMGQFRADLSILTIDTSLISDADAIIRSETSRYNITSAREFTHTCRKAVTILDHQSDQLNIAVPYDKYSRAEILFINMYDGSGQLIRKVKKSEIHDIAAFDGISILNDSRLKVVRLNGGQPPFTIEYEWIITHSQTMMYYPWQPVSFNESVEHASFILEYPSDLTIQHRSFAIDPAYDKTIENGRTTETFTLSKVAAKTEEEFGPPSYEVLPAVYFAPGKFEVEIWSGSFSDWNAYGQFMYELNKGQETLSEEMKLRVLNMVKNCSTDQEKIDTLYSWLQRNMRYVSIQVGIGGWRSFDAPYVEKNQFGDCKALSTFMKGMLEVAGISSHQVLINWDEEEGLFPDDFVTVDFNHMMLHLPEEDMWLECTSNDYPAGVIHAWEENRKVLLITPTGGIIMEMPRSSGVENQIHRIDSLFISDQIRIKGDYRYSGNSHLPYRHFANDISPEDQRKHFLDHSELEIARLNHFHASSSPNLPVAEVKFEALLSKYGNHSGNRYFIPLNTIHLRDDFCPAEERQSDFLFRENFSEINDIVITIPPDFVIEHLPVPVDHTFRGNTYSSKVTIEGGYVRVRQEQSMNAMRLTPEEYKEFCSFNQSVNKANHQMIVLKKTRA